MINRTCEWCKADISHRHGLAKFCDEKCKLRNHYGGPIAGDDVNCRNCGMPFVKIRNESHCSQECRESFKAFRRYGQGKSLFGPPKPRQCDHCGKLFSAFDPKRKYCEAKGRCAQAAWRISHAGQSYYHREDVKERIRSASRRHYATEHGKLSCRKRDAKAHNVARRKAYRKSDHGKAINREWQRCRAAETAISMLILPIEEIKQ